MATAAEELQHPTLFNAATCLRKGLCTVSKTRTPQAHNLYYEIHGDQSDDAKLLVFIMGLNNSSFGWYNQATYFASKPGYRVLLMDNRGVGNSDTPWGLYKTSEMAKDIEELLEYIGWIKRRSLHLIGVSMGGMIAQELATSIPDRIVSLSLVSTSAGNKAASTWKANTMFAKLFFVRTAEAMISIAVNGLYPQHYLDAPDERGEQDTNRTRIEMEFMRRYNITRKQPFSGRVFQSAAALTHHVSPARLLELDEKIPKIAIMTGDMDDIVNPQRSRDLHSFLPRSDLQVYEGGGHALPSQFADRLNAHLERVFEEGLTGASRSQ